MNRRFDNIEQDIANAADIETQDIVNRMTAPATTSNPPANPSPPQDSSHSLIELNSLNRIKMNRITANRIELIKSKFNEIESNEICPGVSNLCPDFKRQHHHSECWSQYLDSESQRVDPGQGRHPPLAAEASMGWSGMRTLWICRWLWLFTCDTAIDCDGFSTYHTWHWLLPSTHAT